MKVIKGIVLESNRRSVTLLTGGGDFVKVKANNNYAPGMEVEIAVPQGKKILNTASLAAASIILIFSAVLTFYHYFMPLAYVALDINPSLLLTLNRRAEVIKIEGINQDGRELISTLDFKKGSAEEAIEIIIQKAYEEKYLTPEKYNIIFISLASSSDYPLHKDALEISAHREVACLGVEAYLKVTTVDRGKVKEAREMETSVNTLLVLDELKEKGLCEKSSPDEILPAGISVGNLLQTVSPEAFFDEKEFIPGRADEGENADRGVKDKGNTSNNKKEAPKGFDKLPSHVPEKAINNAAKGNPHPIPPGLEKQLNPSGKAKGLEKQTETANENNDQNDKEKDKDNKIKEAAKAEKEKEGEGEKDKGYNSATEKDNKEKETGKGKEREKGKENEEEKETGNGKINEKVKGNEKETANDQKAGKSRKQIKRPVIIRGKKSPFSISPGIFQKRSNNS